MKFYLLLALLAFSVLSASAQSDPTYTLTVSAGSTSATSTWDGSWATINGIWTRSIGSETVSNVPPPDGGSGTIVISDGTTWKISSLFHFNGTIIVKSGGALVFERNASSSGQLVMDEDSKIILEEGSEITSTGTGNSHSNHNYLQIGDAALYGEEINNLPPPPLTIDERYINIILPVNLLYFTATPQKTEIKLEWASSKAWDFSHYELERSADGISFEYLMTIDAEENTDWIVNYTCSDRQPLSGLSYYRLKVVDIDGQFEYKGIEVVRFTGAASFIVYPNPSNRGVLNVQQQAATGSRVNLKDNSGRTVYAGAMEAAVKTIDTSSLQPGMYVLTLESTTGVQKKHVIIQ